MTSLTEFDIDLAPYGAKLAPPVVAVEVNDRCASLCGHCSFGQMRAEGPLLELDELIEAVRDAYAYGCRVLTVAAREPFLPGAAPRTLAVLREARDLGYASLAAITSARFLAAAGEELARAGLRLASLDVSVDGLGALHDRLRGVSEWQMVERDLRRERYAAVTGSLCVSATLQRDNADGLLDLLDWLAAEARVDAVLIATTSVGGLNSPESGLLAGQFTDFLEKLETWYDRHSPTLQVALELTPASVPEICELAARGVLPPSAVGLGAYGFPMLRRPSGLPVRVVAGLFSLGRVLRIEAGGRARLYYEAPGPGVEPPVFDLRHGRLLDWLEREHRSGRVYQMAVEAARRAPRALECPAWPFHLEHCPTLSTC